MTNLSDIIDESPKECRALIITLIIAITSLTTVLIYIYTTKDSAIKNERKICEAMLNKKDIIIEQERSKYNSVIDSIILNQREQLARIKRRAWQK